MADKTVAFVTKTADYAATTPAFVPSFVNLAELMQDVAGVNALTPLRQQLEQLALDTDSTVMLAGSEAYTNALTIYSNIKFMAKNKQPGAQAAYDDLSVRFPGRLTKAAAKEGVASKISRSGEETSGSDTFISSPDLFVGTSKGAFSLKLEAIRAFARVKGRSAVAFSGNPLVYASSSTRFLIDYPFLAACRYPGGTRA